MYTTQARTEAYLGRDLTDNEADTIDDVIEYISSFIDSFTHRHWLPLVDGEDEDSDEYTEGFESEARVFDGNGSKELFIEDFTTLESIKILDSQGNTSTTIDQDTDYILNPRNKNPRNSIYLRNYHFPIGFSNIEITAVWGAGTVPKGIVVATTVLVSKYLQKKATSGAGFKSESIEGYSYTLQTSAEIDGELQEVLGTLGMYKRIVL